MHIHVNKHLTCKYIHSNTSLFLHLYIFAICWCKLRLFRKFRKSKFVTKKDSILVSFLSKLTFSNISECVRSGSVERNGNPEPCRPPLPPKVNRSSTNLNRNSTNLNRSSTNLNTSSINLNKSNQTLSDLDRSSYDHYFSNSDLNKNLSDRGHLPTSDRCLSDRNLCSESLNKNTFNQKQKLSLDLSGKGTDHIP